MVTGKANEAAKRWTRQTHCWWPCDSPGARGHCMPRSLFDFMSILYGEAGYCTRVLYGECYFSTETKLGWSMEPTIRSGGYEIGYVRNWSWVKGSPPMIRGSIWGISPTMSGPGVEGDKGAILPRPLPGRGYEVASVDEVDAKVVRVSRGARVCNRDGKSVLP